MKNTCKNNNRNIRTVKLIVLLCAILFCTTACAVPRTYGARAAAAVPSLILGETWKTQGENAEADSAPADRIWIWSNGDRAERRISRETAPEEVPDSVLQVMPMVQAVIFAHIYAFEYKDLGDYSSVDLHSTDANSHLLDDEDYVWSILESMLNRYGYKHPDAVVGQITKWNETHDSYTLYHNCVALPESAARDFMEICFADYTADFVMPQAPTEEWAKKYDLYNDLSYEDGQYTVVGAVVNTEGDMWYNNRHMLVVDAGEADGMYELDLIVLEGPDWVDLGIYHVDLVPNEEENVFGFRWRIKTVVRKYAASKGDYC